MNRYERRAKRAIGRRASARMAKVEAKLPALRGEMKKRVRLAVLQVQHDYDEKVEGMMQRWDGPAISCKPGCFACCRMPIDATVEEAMAILDRYPERVREVRDELFAQNARLDEICKPFGDKWQEHAQDIADVWFDEDRYCAFLLDGQCSIYDARPMPCRNYFVVSDPALCAAPKGTEVQVVNPIPRDKLYLYFSQRMPHGGVSAGYFQSVMCAAIMLDDRKSL